MAGGFSSGFSSGFNIGGAGTDLLELQEETEELSEGVLKFVATEVHLLKVAGEGEEVSEVVLRVLGKRQIQGEGEEIAEGILKFVATEVLSSGFDGWGMPI